MGQLDNIKNSSSGSLKTIAKDLKAREKFLLNCQHLIIDAYLLLKVGKKFNPQWEEETFSANMQEHLEDARGTRKLPYFITAEERQLSPEILSGKVRAKKARRIDIGLATFVSSKKLRYIMEAKILVENSTATRRPGNLCEEYITEGVDRFVAKIYEYEGCMVGYIVQGDPDKVKGMINDKFDEALRGTEKLGNKFNLKSHPYCYVSKHSNCSLHHFHFVFT